MREEARLCLAQGHGEGVHEDGGVDEPVLVEVREACPAVGAPRDLPEVEGLDPRGLQRVDPDV